jgi:hypothetical protein
MSPVAFLLFIPFGCIVFTLGMVAARAMIVANPGQAGLRPRSDQQQDESVVRWTVGRLASLRAEEARLSDQLFLATERMKAREAGRLGEAP